MMGAKADADCGEYAEVDPTGRYGRVRYHHQPLPPLPPFLDSFSLPPRSLIRLLHVPQYSDVLGRGASKTV